MIGLTVQLVHGKDVVVADVEAGGVLLALVVGEHDGVRVGAVGEPERVPDLVHGHGEEVHRHRGRRVAVGVPRLVLVEVDVAAAAPELVGVVGVRENET